MNLLAKILMLSVLVSAILCDGPCPWNLTDAGIVNGKQWCMITDQTYGRGAGYPWKFGDRLNLNGAMNRCLNDNRSLGCEQWGAVIYPKCRQGFVNSACCLCNPTCPSGWSFITITDGNPGWYCQKN